MRAVLLWFLIPVLSYGQCDIEIVGFNPISTDMTITVLGGACMTENDSVGEFLLGLTFQPPIENPQDTWPCFYPDGWAYLIFPLNFPGFDIGEGDDQILQTGDTVTFNLLETPWAGSGTANCWIEIFQDAAYFEECVVTAVTQINDNQEFGDDNLFNSWITWSLNGACDPPPPPVVLGCTDMFAYNYNVQATEDDGSCVYQGCVDPAAINYCEECTIVGPCEYYPEAGENCNDPLIFCPNTFTPNNDGANDYWKPVTTSACWWKWECRVYNRWGTLVWISYDPDDKWLGNRLAAFVPDGVYVWTIKATTFQSTKAVEINGTVTVFR
jgi:gliding motility-associated-like protein